MAGEIMYFHIGMNVYMRQERVIGIFPATILSSEFQRHNLTIVTHEVTEEDAKACILTENQELHLSNVNCRTLRQRWNTSLV